MGLAARQDRDRNTVAVEQAVAGECGEPRAWREESHEVERIGRRKGQPFSRVDLAPRLAQHSDRVRQGELLAREAGDEAAAADVAAALEPAVDAQQVAP